jgi:stage II sporulation protein P
MARKLILWIRRLLILVIAALVLLLTIDSGSPVLNINNIGKWIQPTVACSKIIVNGFKVSRLGGEFCLVQNICGFKPQERLPLSFKAIMQLAGVAFDEPYQMMAANIQPLMAITAPAAATVSNTDPASGAQTAKEEQPGDNSGQAEAETPKIAVYCTHNGETYLPDSHTSRMDNKRGLINDVADSLAQDLNNLGIATVYDPTMHDSPDYNLSYVRSRETVQRLLKQYPDLTTLIDIHRDAIPEPETAAVITVGGKKASQILLIIGSDQRTPNPNWPKNLAFADALYQQGAETYPGLIRGVRVKPGTYNQDLHQPAILVEVGNQYNTLEQANYGVELFANILDKVLSEGETDD